MHMKHVPRWMEARREKLHHGAADRFLSPYIFIMWIICAVHNYVAILDDIQILIMGLYSVISAAHKTVQRKRAWDNDMHVLENTTTNLAWLVTLDFLCNAQCALLSIIWLQGFAFAGAAIYWVAGLVAVGVQHCLLFTCYQRVVRRSIRTYNTISQSDV